MSEHNVELKWKRDTEDFKYKTYTRDHAVVYGEGTRICASAAPEYNGNPACFNPEQAFVTSLASCHMLTFLALACKKGFVVDSYEDHAAGTLGRNEQRMPAIVQARLKPVVVFSGDVLPSQDEFEKLHTEAHDKCFIANSIAQCVHVIVEPEMKHA